MLASNSVKELEGEGNDLNNVFYDFGEKNKYLKSSVLYGANGSGKSNLLSAIGFFRSFILYSSNDRQGDDKIDVIPFLLSSETENSPSSFEMIFAIDDVRYRYGFEVTKENITAEWLFVLDLKTGTKESNFFTREKQNINVLGRNFKEGKGLESKTRPNALFLSTVAQLNGEQATKIQKWFKRTINIISGLEDSTTGYTIGRFQSELDFKKKIIDFIKLIDLGIEDIKIEEKVFTEFASKIAPNGKTSDKIASLLEELQKEIKGADDAKEITINAYHKKYGNDNTIIENVPMDFGLESRGTQKLFALLGPLLDTIENGKILIVDELDSRLHTKLTIELLKIFESKINKKNAQLIFASHDTNLLRGDLFRRDQIWFAEKNPIGATDLYSLVEYKINKEISVRNDASFEKDYLIGKYGAIPYFGNIEKFLNEFVNEQQEVR